VNFFLHAEISSDLIQQYAIYPWLNERFVLIPIAVAGRESNDQQPCIKGTHQVEITP
jgi:hypothetical protein